MAAMSYSDQLRHPNWQRRRLQVLESAGWRCTCCLADDKPLHVHHRRYIRGRMAWDYEDADLQSLCDDCHLEQHERRADLDALLAGAPSLPIEDVVDLLRGFTARMTGASHEAAISDPTTFVIGQIADQLRSASWEEIQALRLRLAGA